MADDRHLKKHEKSPFRFQRNLAWRLISAFFSRPKNSKFEKSKTAAAAVLKNRKIAILAAF